ncbi:hypothetical protein niasHT_035117 [Heterodera trifolii]|uniref:Uncharacterized protein n=1 Tax=Heterodera trifolii TaxID=157864 RepID=A0ABD2IEI6_9BILA
MARHTLNNVFSLFCLLQIPSFLLAFQLRFPPYQRHISLAQFASMLNEDEHHPLVNRRSSFDDGPFLPAMGKRAFDRLDASSLGLSGYNAYWPEEEPLNRLAFGQQQFADAETEPEKPSGSKKHRRWARPLAGTKRRVNGFGLFGQLRL